jgi:colicin import membrane protein
MAEATDSVHLVKLRARMGMAVMVLARLKAIKAAKQQLHAQGLKPQYLPLPQIAEAGEAYTAEAERTKAALQRVKDDAARATAEAERAKVDAKAARESEETAKRKLADADAARVAAEGREQGCQSAAKKEHDSDRGLSPNSLTPKILRTLAA